MNATANNNSNELWRQSEVFFKMDYFDNQLSFSTNGIYLCINPRDIAMSKDMLLALTPKILKSFGIPEKKVDAIMSNDKIEMTSYFIDSLALSFKHTSGKFSIEYTLNEEGNLNCKFDGEMDFQIINYLSDLKGLINQLMERD